MKRFSINNIFAVFGNINQYLKKRMVSFSYVKKFACQRLHFCLSEQLRFLHPRSGSKTSFGLIELNFAMKIDSDCISSLFYLSFFAIFIPVRRKYFFIETFT